MKLWTLMSLLILSVTCSLVLGQGPADLRAFMHAKLKHSERVLEGLVLNDLPQVAKGAESMKALSLDASWQVLQTPKYVELSSKFRADADALATAARDQNLDKATKTYNQVVLRCVECHKYVRDVQMARAGN